MKKLVAFFFVAVIMFFLSIFGIMLNFFVDQCGRSRMGACSESLDRDGVFGVQLSFILCYSLRVPGRTHLKDIGLNCRLKMNLKQLKNGHQCLEREEGLY